MNQYKHRVCALSKATDDTVAAHVKYLHHWHEKLSERISDCQKENDYKEIICNEKKLCLNTRANYQKEIDALHAAIQTKKSVINELMNTKQGLENEFSEIDNSCKTLEKYLEKQSKLMEEKRELLKFYRCLTGVDFNPTYKCVTGYSYNASNGDLKPFILEVDEPDKNCDTIWKQLEKQFL